MEIAGRKWLREPAQLCFASQMWNSKASNRRGPGSQVLSGAGQPSLAQIESKLNELAQTAQQIASAVRRFEGS